MASRAIIGPLQPRGLAREAAAAYCGLNLEGFNEWVKRGIAPGPIPGTPLWETQVTAVASG